jgi:hypothetical protein
VGVGAPRQNMVTIQHDLLHQATLCAAKPHMFSRLTTRDVRHGKVHTHREAAR